MENKLELVCFVLFEVASKNNIVWKVKCIIKLCFCILMLKTCKIV